MLASEVPEKPHPDGTEKVILVDGEPGALTFKSARIDAIAAAAVAPQVAAAQAARTGAETAEDNASASTVLAGGHASAAAVSAALALGALGVLGPEASYANLVANIAAYANNDLIRVTADETHGGQVSIYRKVAGAPVYQNGGQVTAQPDKLGRYRVPARMLGKRTAGTKLLRKLHNCAAGTEKTVNLFVAGDSLASTSWSTFNVELMRNCEPWLPSTPVYCDSIGTIPGLFSNFNATSGGIGYTGSTGTAIVKTDYDIAWDGSGYKIANGQVSVGGVGGNNAPMCDEIIVFIEIESGAGEVKIEIGEGAGTVTGSAYRNPTAGEIISGGSLNGSGELVVNVDNATPDIAIVRLQFATTANRVIRQTQVGGAGKVARLVPIMFRVRLSAAINVYRMANASNNFVNVSPAATARIAKMIGALDIDAIIVESDDNTAAYQALLPQLIAARAACGLAHKPDVLLPTNPYYYLNGAPYDEHIWQRGEWVTDAIAGLFGYDAPDLMAFAGGYNEIIPYGLDPIHYNGVLSQMAARNYCLQAGYVRNFPVAPGTFLTPTETWALPVPGSRAEDKVLRGRDLSAALARPARDLSRATWSGDAVGTGALDTSTSAIGDFKLSSATGANTHKAAYIAQPSGGGFSAGGSLLGNRLGALDGAQLRAVTTRIMAQGWGTANGEQFFFGCFMGAHDAGYAATFPADIPTGEHIGFRVYWEAATGKIWVEGSTWTTVQQTTATRVELRQSPNPFTMDLGWRARPGVTSAIQGFVDFFAGDTWIGELPYRHTQTLCAPKAFIKKSASGAAAIHMWVQPPFIELAAVK